MRLAAGIALAVILVAHGIAVVAALDRPLHYDENEYMHSSWLMAAGKEIYRDFYEDHTPHFFLLLHSVMPGGELTDLDVRVWAMRARVLTGFCGTALVVLLGVFAWRLSGEPAAAVVAAAVLLASSQMWARGLSDIRAEPVALMLFWAGVVLLTWTTERDEAQALRAGFGIGLVVLAEAMNPKWPLEGLVMGVVYLLAVMRMRRGQLTRAIVPAIALTAISIAPIAGRVRDCMFFVFTLKRGLAESFTSQPWVRDLFRRHPLWETTDPHLRWWFFVPVAFIVAASLRRSRLVWIAVALHVAAIIEMRFLLPYPYLWAQYLVMIASTAAILYALLPAALARIRANAIVWILVTAAAAVAWSAWAGLAMKGDPKHGWAWWSALIAAAIAWIPVLAAAVIGSRQGDAMTRPMLAAIALAWSVTATLVPLGTIAAAGMRRPQGWRAYWQRIAGLQARLGPNDTVWISPPRHPVTAFDASYFGYSFSESVPYVVPRLRMSFAGLPLCAIARGEKSNVKFVELGTWIPYLEGSCECGERAVASGALQPSDYFGIFEVTAEPRRAEWFERSRRLWPNLCRNRAFFAAEGVFERAEAALNRGANMPRGR